MLSLCLCDYFSRKLLATFEFPYLKARYVLFFHRKEFRRKNNGEAVEFLNHVTLLRSMTVIFKYKLCLIINLIVFFLAFVTDSLSSSSLVYVSEFKMLPFKIYSIIDS